jgi:tRNA G26 N,N-dimethylase Trm1
MSSSSSSYIPNPSRLHKQDLLLSSSTSTTTTTTTSTTPVPPLGFQTITEGAAVALYKSGKVFYNRVQIFNRDLSVLAIRAWDERRLAEARANPKLAKKAWVARGEWPSSSVSTTIHSSTSSSALPPPPPTTTTTATTKSQSTIIEWSSSTSTHHGNTPSTSSSILPPMRILEALAASGLRTMRYARELPKGRVSLIVANDLEAAAIDAITLNVKFNGLGLETPQESTSSISTSKSNSVDENMTSQNQALIYSSSKPQIIGNAGDACLVMLCSSRGIALPGTMQKWLTQPLSKTANLTDSTTTTTTTSSSTTTTSSSSNPSPFLFDVIDLDPYGTASPFLDSALQAISEGGLLCVTCTDMAVLAGNHMDVCHSKYGSIPVKAKHYNEQALRIVLACIESSANKHRKSIKPLLSVSVDFYVRVFVTVHSSAQACNEAPIRLANIHQCTGCDAHWFWPLGKGGSRGKERGLWKPESLSSHQEKTLESIESIADIHDIDRNEESNKSNTDNHNHTSLASLSSIQFHDSSMIEEEVDSKIEKSITAIEDTTEKTIEIVSRRELKKRAKIAQNAQKSTNAAALSPVRQRLVTANTAPDLSCECPHCGRPVVIGGPLWLDPIHDIDYVKAVNELGEACFGNDGLGPKQEEVEDINSVHDRAGPMAQYYNLRTNSSFETSSTSTQIFDKSQEVLTIQRPVYDGGSNDVQTVSASRRRLLGVLRSAQEETERVPNVPLYYDLSSLSKTLHSTTISLPNMQSALLNAGYIVGASHCAPNVVKTDAPPVVILDIMREWARQNGISPPSEQIIKSNTSKKLSSYSTAAEAILSIQRQSTLQELPLISSPGVYSSPSEAERIVGETASAWWKKPEVLKETLRLKKERMANGIGQRFIPNPGSQWGPMARANGQIVSEEGPAEKKPRTE